MSWITINEAAEALEVSPQTVRRRVKTGALPSRLQKGMRLVQLPDGQDIIPLHRITTRDPELLAILFKIFESFRTLKSQCGYQVGIVKNKQKEGPELDKWNFLYQKIVAQCDALDGLVSEMIISPKILQNVYREALVIRDLWSRYDQWNDNQGFISRQIKINEFNRATMEGVLNRLREILIGCFTPIEMDDNE